MNCEEYLSPKSREELLSSIPRIRLREGGAGESARFTVPRDWRNEFSRGGLDFRICGTLSGCGSGTRVRFRVLPGPSSLFTFLLLLGILVFCLARLLIRGMDSVSPVFLVLVSSFFLIRVTFWLLLRREVRKDFLCLLQERNSARPV